VGACAFGGPLSCTDRQVLRIADNGLENMDNLQFLAIGYRTRRDSILERFGNCGGHRVTSHFTHPWSIGLRSLNLEDDAQSAGWARSEFKGGRPPQLSHNPCSCLDAGDLCLLKLSIDQWS